MILKCLLSYGQERLSAQDQCFAGKSLGQRMDFGAFLPVSFDAFAPDASDLFSGLLWVGFSVGPSMHLDRASSRLSLCIAVTLNREVSTSSHLRTCQHAGPVSGYVTLGYEVAPSIERRIQSA